MYCIRNAAGGFAGASAFPLGTTLPYTSGDASPHIQQTPAAQIGQDGDADPGQQRNPGGHHRQAVPREPRSTDPANDAVDHG